MKKIQKGKPGYLNYKRKVEILRTVIYFVIVLAIFALGYWQTHTRLNLLTVVAILGCLPASKALVGVIARYPYQSIELSQAKEIAGCENRVWLGVSVSCEKLHFFCDSEGRIVRGLLAVLLTAIEGKSAAELLAHSPLALFDELGLRAQLSASRGQGLVALSEAVQDAARQAQA